jgi:hypothetical protein
MKDGKSAWHCAVGRIRYDEVDQAAVPGVLVYLQGSLTGDEPPDILQYVVRNPDFPRQSTLNQFFDEMQFECYRALGHHIAHQVFGAAAEHWTGRTQNPDQYRAEVQAVFAHIRQQWYPPPPSTEGEAIASATVALDLEKSLAHPELVDLNVGIYPELGHFAGGAPVPPAQVREFLAVNQILQVMELAWSAEAR